MLPTFKPTRDDYSAVVNFTCAVLGIGSVAMGRNFGQAGIWPATCALLLMFVINSYASIALSKAMLKSPDRVNTFPDLGEYAFGPFGKYAVLITQFTTCLVVPIAFLVLGGATIMPVVMEGGNANVYILLMGLALWPIVLIRSLKEATWVALLGSAGTFFGDLFAVMDSMFNSPYYSDITPVSSPNSVLKVFGSMSMAFGGAVIIPGLQREHSRPEHMPTIILCVFGMITLSYFLIGIQGYHQYGCIAPKNLLLAMTSPGMEKAAMLMFFIHIALAFAVYVSPAMHFIERNLLGFYQHDDDEEKMNTKYTLQSSPSRDDAPEPSSNIFKSERFKSILLRTTVLGTQVFIALLAQSSFEDLADFAGASCITLSCIILPVLIYCKICYDTISRVEKIWAVFVVLVSVVLGTYTSYLYLKTITENASKYQLFYSPVPITGARDLLHPDVQQMAREYCRATPFQQA